MLTISSYSYIRFYIYSYHEEHDDGANQHPDRAGVIVPHVVMNLATLTGHLQSKDTQDDTVQDI